MKLLLAAAAALSMALLPVAADAHGPTRKKVTETVDINAPAEKVWAAIGNFQDMSWHPAVTANVGQGGNAVDATRKLTLQGGGTIDEVLYKFEPEQKSYSYRIAEVDVKVLPVTNYSSTITVTPIDATHSKVEWRGAFYRGYPNNDPPPELSDEAAIAAVTGVYRGGLDALKAKLEKGS
ncbi:SRPBCC family protein [Xanthobacter oligotrophicus]|uniref:SRPBCC family protein n=1 Tax=Xanthobacter oligotrophicus TaxID=2607286 RepID=A0ABW7A093_9HYPH|nr:SRPBCC family protein [Xanthobacter oligotrophicus]MCG5235114.1 SRPBCC family protein [Xanthobacter oligotrophicus]